MKKCEKNGLRFKMKKKDAESLKASVQKPLEDFAPSAAQRVTMEDSDLSCREVWR